MDELWQLYDEQGRPLVGRGANKTTVFKDSLLHGAAHVWIWRKSSEGIELLLQKRAANKLTWPNRYDISAAGHINLGEDPLTAAIRETQEEIGLTIPASDLRCIGVQRVRMATNNGTIENEFQWLYVLELPNETVFTMQEEEVSHVEWKKLADFSRDITQNSQDYVPHSKSYFALVLEAIASEQNYEAF